MMEEPMSLLALPSDVLVLVASYCGALSRLALFATCQATRQLVLSTAAAVTLRLQRGCKTGVVASMLTTNQADHLSCRQLSISSISQAPGFLQLLPMLPIITSGHLELLKMESLDVKEGAVEATLCKAAQHVQHLHLENCSLSSRRLLNQLVATCPSLKQLTLVDVRGGTSSKGASSKGKKGGSADQSAPQTELCSAVSAVSGLKLALANVASSLIGAETWVKASELTVSVGGGQSSPPSPQLLTLLRGPHQFARLTCLTLTPHAGLVPWSTVRVVAPKLPALQEVRLLGMVEPTSASVSGAFTWPPSVKRLAVVRLHASTPVVMPEIAQVEELQLGVLRVDLTTGQGGGLEVLGWGGLQRLQAVGAITGLSPGDRCAWRQSVRLELALPEVSGRAPGQGQCVCKVISQGLGSLPSGLHLSALSFEWPPHQPGGQRRHSITSLCPDCQPGDYAKDLWMKSFSRNFASAMQGRVPFNTQNSSPAVADVSTATLSPLHPHVMLPAYKIMLGALATSLGHTLRVLCLEAKRLLQGYEEAADPGAASAMALATRANSHPIGVDEADAPGDTPSEERAVMTAAATGVSEWQGILTGLPHLSLLGLPDWGRHLSRGGPHTEAAGKLLMSDIGQACKQLCRHLEVQVLMGWRFTTEACTHTEGLNMLPWMTVNVLRDLQST